MSLFRSYGCSDFFYYLLIKIFVTLFSLCFHHFYNCPSSSFYIRIGRVTDVLMFFLQMSFFCSCSNNDVSLFQSHRWIMARSKGLVVEACFVKAAAETDTSVLGWPTSSGPGRALFKPAPAKAAFDLPAHLPVYVCCFYSAAWIPQDSN